jgi:hypothetical protein
MEILISFILIGGVDITNLQDKEMPISPYTFSDSIAVDWGINWLALKNGAEIIAGSEDLEYNKENEFNATHLFDQDKTTKWKSDKYPGDHWVIIRLPRKAEIKRIIICNDFTDHRGTGGGNDAVKEVEIWASSEKEPRSFQRSLYLKLIGPTEVCKDLGGGRRICWFEKFDKFQIFNIEPFEATYLKIVFVSAYWSEDALKLWPEALGICLAEIMAFSE